MLTFSEVTGNSLPIRFSMIMITIIVARRKWLGFNEGSVIEKDKLTTVILYSPTVILLVR